MQCVGSRTGRTAKLDNFADFRSFANLPSGYLSSMKWSFKVGRIFGIGLRVHITFFLIVLYFAYIWGVGYEQGWQGAVYGAFHDLDAVHLRGHTRTLPLTHGAALRRRRGQHHAVAHRRHLAAQEHARGGRARNSG